MRIYSFHRRKMSICLSFGLFILDNHDIGLITVHASGHLESLSTTLRLLQCLLRKSLFYAQRRTQAEHENVLKSFITSVLCSDSEK